MAKLDIKIPAVLPPIENAINMIVRWRDSPSKMLNGIAPIKLFNLYTDIDRTWFVGSNVWYPAVLGLPCPPDADIDIVFHNKEACDTFAEHAKRTLEETDDVNKYTMEPNRYGGQKLIRHWKDTSLADHRKSFMDTWWLPNGQSIAEHICGFPRDHERCAMMAGAIAGEFGALTRVVRPNPVREFPAPADAAADVRAAVREIYTNDYGS